MPRTLKAQSVKRAAISIIRRLPESCTLKEIAYHLYVGAEVEAGIQDAAEGRTYTQEEVERMSLEWLKSSFELT